MERMEVEDSASGSPPENEPTRDMEIYWCAVNTPVHGILKNVKETGAEDDLLKYLESVKESIDNPINIFIPTCLVSTASKNNNNNINNIVEQVKSNHKKYDLFTIWMSGMLFYIGSVPTFSKRVINSCENVQIKLLKFLYWFNSREFNLIYSRYIQVLDFLLLNVNDDNEFDENDTNLNLTICNFKVERSFSAELDLTTPPMVIDSRDRILPIIVSVLKVLVNSKIFDSYTLHRKTIWLRTITMLKNLDPEVKILALKLMSKIIEFTDCEEQIKLFLIYTQEIFESANNWQWCTWNKQASDKLNQVATKIIDEIAINRKGMFNLCLNIISCCEDQHLLKTSCQKIISYLEEYPMALKNNQFSDETHQRLLVAFKRFDNDEIFHVIARVIFTDIFILAGNSNKKNKSKVLSISKSSLLWQQLMDFVNDQQENSLEYVKYISRLFKIARLLSNGLRKNTDLHGKFFLDYQRLCQILTSHLETAAEDTNLNVVQLIYYCFMDLMSFIEPSSTVHSQLFNILLLPLLTGPSTKQSHEELPFKNNDLVIRVSKNVNIDTKVACINTICQFYHSNNHLTYLSALITATGNSNLNEQADKLAVAVILNSTLLISNEIRFPHVNMHILKPVYVGKKRILLEALAKVIGPIVCLLSGKAKIIQSKFDSLERKVHCDICDSENYCYNSNNLIKEEDEKVLRMYLNLLTCDNVVRRNIADNLLRLSNHTRTFNTNEVTKLWLPWIRDADKNVRIKLALSIEVIIKNRLAANLPNYQNTFHDDWPENLRTFIETIVNELNFTLNTVFDQKLDASVHKTLLITTKYVARIPIYFIEQRLYFIFISSIIHASSQYIGSFTASVYYKETAGYYNLTPKEIFLRHRTEMIRLIVRLIARNYYVKPHYNLSLTLNRLSNCFGFIGAREIFRRHGSLIMSVLIPLVVKVQPRINNILREITFLMSASESEIYSEYFKYIFPYIFLNEDADTVNKCLKLIAEKTQKTLHKLIGNNFFEIFREILLHFYDKQTKVISCLNTIIEYSDDEEAIAIASMGFDNKENVVQYLSPRLLAILVFFDANLNPDKSNLYTQRCALRSLGALIKFMGVNYINQLKHKILAILRAALRNFSKHPELRRLAYDAWDAFIHTIALDELGPLLPTICISLVPLLEVYPAEINNMLEYILITNYAAVLEDIHDLFFLNDLPAIKTEILNKIKPLINKAPGDFVTKLQIWQRRIIHETDEVRLKALIHLKSFLQKHRTELNDMILNHNATNHVHPAIVNLLDALLAGCRQQEASTENNQQYLRQDIRHWSGECLGELGAIEPNLLPRRIISRGDSKFMPEMNAEFACDLLNELVRAFNEQNTTRNVDCFSLAIQEILKIWEIKPEGENSNLWHSFSPLTQQIIFPMLTSSYTLSSRDTNNINYPIYGTVAAQTFESWVCNWVYRMISSLNSGKNSDNENYKKIKFMLNSCWPAFKRDLETTIFCIPQLVTMTVIHGNDSECDGLVREILAVIRVTNNDGHECNRKRAKLRLTKNSFDDIKYLNSNINSNGDNSCQSNDPQRISSDERRQIRCSQVIFSTLDHLRRWLQENRQRYKKTSKYQAVENFINRLDNLQLAESCYESHEYYRALMYLEQHMANNKDNGVSWSHEMNLLAKIYTLLEEPDGVFGILASQDHSPTIEQQVLAHEVGGKMQEAVTCYERLAQRHNFAPKYIKGIIKCYLSLEQPFTAINITSGILNSKPELEPHLTNSEPFWQLAHFLHLDDSNDNNMFNRRNNDLDSSDDEKAYIKRILMVDLRQAKRPNLSALKQRLISTIGLASSHQDAYQQSYSHIMKLHVINEFEKAMQVIIKDINRLPSIFNEWEKRSSLVRASRNVEFVMGMRRGALYLALALNNNEELANTDRLLMKRLKNGTKSTLKEEIGKIWLKSAKIARKSGLHQQAYRYILSASDYCPPQELHIEKAQLYWQKKCREDAFNTLKRSFKQCYKPVEVYRQTVTKGLNEDERERKNLAKAKLLFAQYNDQTFNVGTEVNSLYYKEAVDVYRNWEKSYLIQAQYHDSLVERMNENERFIGKGLQYQRETILSYCRALLLGSKYIHQSMPRMLTIWTNLGSWAFACNNPSSEQLSVLKKISKVINLYVERFPKFVWLTALSQLISRICHPETTIRTTINQILANLIITYPQYCLWMMASVINSSYSARKKCCQEILDDPKLNTRELKKYLNDFKRLWECFMDVSNQEVNPKIHYVRITELSKTLVSLLASPDFGPISMPTSLFFELRLPLSSNNAENQGYNPFPQNTNAVYIKSIEQKVEVLTSLARPRKITLVGSDGKRYSFMCKPKDDLRKDFRLMEFNSIVNNYLQKDPESRQRRLHIRMYSVIPIDEECGLVEWINNLTGFRPIILQMYKERGIPAMTGKELAAHTCDGAPLEKKRAVYLTKLLPRYPAVFGDWFRLNFPDAYGWYEARNAYIRTTAVMSMVGYILGLGDRHGENILIDSKCGDCVHVDFNCLFNRGETFTCPERVPFRLTHNMVDAMGPLRYEGPFRRSCQITMRILKQQTSTLMSVLTPFVYDPLVSWNKGPVAAERTNEKALKNIQDIELRLKGVVTVKRELENKKPEVVTLNLSVEGQTNHVILDATSIDNLCQMYIGWSPFM